MNMGSSASACSGVAFFSKTAWAAAQHRSSVSVNSIAASRTECGMDFCTSIFVSNGFTVFTSFPFNANGGKSLCLEAFWGKQFLGHLQ